MFQYIKYLWSFDIEIHVAVIHVSSPNEMSHMCKFKNIELYTSLERADIKLSYDA